MFPRALAFALTFVLTLPAVAFGADLLQRDAETVDLTAPLRAGSVFRYDITALSDPAALTSLAEEALEVRFDVEDGNLTVATERRPTHWDAFTRPSQFGMHTPDHAAFSATIKETLTPAGDLPERRTEFQDRQAMADGDGTTAHVWKGARWPGPAGEDSVAARVAEWLSRPARFAPGMDASAGDAYPIRATFEGRTVFGRAEQWVEDHGAGATPFTCPIDVPPVSYTEPRAALRWGASPFTVVVDRTVWRAPGVPLPVLVDCHATFLEDGHKDIGHIHLLARLAGTEPGTDVVLFPSVERHHEGPLPAAAAKVQGVPPDGEAESVLRFPLGDAWATVLASDDPRIAAVRSAGPVPFAVTEAYHEPGDAWASCASVVPFIAPRCGLLHEETGLDVGFVEPTWWLVLHGEGGHRVAVHVLRNMTQEGAVLEDHVVEVLVLHRLAPLDLGSLPDRFVPLNVAYSAWLGDESAVDNRSWQTSEGSAFHYLLAGPGGPTYTFHVLEEAAGARAGKSALPLGGRIYGDTPRTGWFHSFRASDGALVEHGVDRWWRETTDEPLPHPVGQAGVEWVPVADPYVPVAAGAAALGVTFVAAGLARWDPLRRRLLFLLFPLFTKLTREEVLEHRTRDEMIRLVDRNPGVGTEEIRKHLDIGWGTAVYHLSALEQSGILTSLKTGGHRHWFPTKALDADTKRAIATLRSTAARRLYDAILEDPGRTQQELAARLGVTHGAVIFQVRKLERVGLIDKRRDGRFVRYFPTPTRGPDGRPGSA